MADQPSIRHRPVPAHRLPEQLHPVLRRVYAARGVTEPDGLELGLKDLHTDAGLPDLERAVVLLAEAIAEDHRILIVGDFDADGATATAVCVLALRALGARHVDFIVPDRIRCGYGLSPALVEEAGARSPDLLVTVDNGISSHAGVAAARARGWRVIVTDHHLPGPDLPEADAIVDPCLDDSAFPSRNLAGVGVAFYLMAALRRHLRTSGALSGEGPRLANLLDLVALGTVADVVKLDRNNRILVQQGLQRMRAGRARPGLRALMEVAGRESSRMSAADLGFALGPRLNAAGRLEDMTEGIRCLLTEDEPEARALAADLDALNRERRVLERDTREAAELQLETIELQGEPPLALVLADERWHPGIVGLVAGRLKERYHRPAVVFAPEDGGGFKGSARSIPGLHIRDALARVDAIEPGIIRRFGGHAMAAGLTLDPGALDRFRDRLLQAVEEMLDPAALEPTLLTDGPLEADELDLDLALALREGGPWGQGFPEPRFDGRFRILDRREVGQGHLKMQVRHADGGDAIDAIAFGAWGAPGADDEEVQLVYRPDANTFRGRTRLQLIVERLNPL